MKVKRFVIDTNVLISAALSPKGVPAILVRHIIVNNRIVFSEETYEEFHSRLWRPKFDAYISREKRKLLLLDFSNIADWVEISGNIEICRDKEDDKFLEVSVTANADALISGDSDLTVLKSIEGIPIITPNDALSMFVSPRKHA